jgi:hypothetical protein
VNNKWAKIYKVEQLETKILSQKQKALDHSVSAGAIEKKIQTKDSKSGLDVKRLSYLKFGSNLLG